MLDAQTIEYIVYGLAALLLLASTILAIANWTGLSSLSSKITELENDVEKKTFEFANLKKSKAAQQASQPAASTTAQAQEEADNNDEIRVVRNVRAGLEEEKESFLQDEVVHIHHAPSPAEESPEPVPPPAPKVPAAAPVAPQVVAQAPSPAPKIPEPPAPPAAPAAWEKAACTSLHEPACTPPQPLPAAAAPSAPESLQADVLDVIETPDLNAEFSDTDAVIPFTLYSPAKKDADFEQTLAAFNATVPLNAGTPVTLDFSHVMFLYEKELVILEQMNELARQFSCPLRFINCELELKNILKSRQSLAALIRE